MKKAIRRHQQKVAQVRWLNIQRQRYGWRDWFVIWCDGEPEACPCRYLEKPWRRPHRTMMNEPGWWVHEFMIRPMRIRSNQQLRLIEKGRDPDEFQWPDGKKPHVYYW